MALVRDPRVADAVQTSPLPERLFRGALETELARAAGPRPCLDVTKTDDFAVTGRGDAPAWRRAIAHGLRRAAGDGDFSASVKWLWSDAGLYALCTTDDARLSCRRHADFDDLADGDVFVLSLLPDPAGRVGVEYQVNPLGAESFALATRDAEGGAGRWKPLRYGGARAARKAVTIRDGAAEPGSRAAGWTVEAFFPWELFAGLGALPPGPAEWGANFFRVDFDGETPSWRTWSPSARADSFTDFAAAGRMRFVP